VPRFSVFAGVKNPCTPRPFMLNRFMRKKLLSVEAPDGREDTGSAGRIQQGH
jgi:hypothetical protein